MPHLFIALGAATGIAYLHNILLEYTHNPLISALRMFISAALLYYLNYILHLSVIEFILKIGRAHV